MTTPDPDDIPDPSASTVAGLIQLVELQRDVVVAICTGSAMDGYRQSYRERRGVIRRALAARSLDDPFRWPDVDVIWTWAKQWSTYRERRAAVGELINPLLDQLDDLPRGEGVDDWGGAPDHWIALETRLAELRDEIAGASTLDEFQDVGRRSREIIIATVNAMFESDMVPSGSEAPRGSDAKNRLDLVLAAYAPGTSRAELRKLLRSALELAQKVTHADVTRVDAFSAAQATVLLVRTLAEMHRVGRPERGPAAAT